MRSLLMLALLGVAVNALTFNIYTYQENLGPSNWINLFASGVGIDPSTINVTYLLDANEILSAAQVANPVPVPDILLGLDNVLQLETAAALLYPYASPLLADVLPSIVNNLNITGAAPLTPYDYSYITVNANSALLQSTYPTAYNLLTNPNFSLQTFIDNPATLFPLLVLEHPATSGTGINFLTWTVAVFGDPQLGLPGSRGTSGDWRTFWKLAYANKAVVSDSWTDAYFNYFAAGVLPIVISYSTDSSNDICAYNSSSTISLGSRDNDGISRAWQNIEGVGITKTASNDATRLQLAKAFVDFMLNYTLQSTLPLDDYVLPARADVALPACYNATVQLNLQPVNSYLTPPTIQAHLQSWVTEVSAILSGTSTTTGTTGPTPSAAKSTAQPAGAAAAAHVPTWLMIIAASIIVATMMMV